MPDNPPIPVIPQPTADPLPPGTMTQGFLASRWNRRNGTAAAITDNPLQPAPLVDPLPPGTMAQGFLSHRWNRRDGTAYGPRAPLEVLSLTWTLDMPTVVGASIGTCTCIGGIATRWNIVAGNDDGYWAISPSGAVTVAALGFYEEVIYEISVTASNPTQTSAPTEMFIRTVPLRGGPNAESKIIRRD